MFGLLRPIRVPSLALVVTCLALPAPAAQLGPVAALRMPQAGTAPLRVPLVPAQFHGGDSPSEPGGSLGPSVEDLQDWVDGFGDPQDRVNRGRSTIGRDRDLQAAVRRAAARVGIDYAEAVTLLTTSVRVSPLATRLFGAVIDESDADCGRIPDRYRLDCVQQSYEALADTLPRKGDYARVQDALSEVARQLSRIERDSRDRGQPRVALRRADGGRSDRSFTATRPGAATDRAAAAVLEARTTLLRSVAASDPRQAHFQRIAAAFDETAVLLRS